MTEAAREDGKFCEWAILELLGHRRLAGRVQECTIAGAAFLRIDVPKGDAVDEWELTQMYAPSSVYALTPVTEAVARRVAANITIEPVTRWDVAIPALPAASRRDVDVDDDPNDADDDGPF